MPCDAQSRKGCALTLTCPFDIQSFLLFHTLPSVIVRRPSNLAYVISSSVRYTGCGINLLVPEEIFGLRIAFGHASKYCGTQFSETSGKSNLTFCRFCIPLMTKQRCFSLCPLTAPDRTLASLWLILIRKANTRKLIGIAVANC